MEKTTYHVWFSTKHRREALVEEIAETVKTSIREAASRHGIDVLEVELELDHAHLLVALDRYQTLSWAMQMLKGYSSRVVFSRYPDLRLDMRSLAFWQKGYGHRFVQPAEIPILKNYIRTQSERPARHN